MQLFKKQNNFRKENFQFNLNPFWKLSVFVVLFFVIFSFFFGYYLFVQVNQEPVLSITSYDRQIPMIKKDRLDKTLNYFSERGKKSAEILNSPSPVVDPSL